MFDYAQDQNQISTSCLERVEREVWEPVYVLYIHTLGVAVLLANRRIRRNLTIIATPVCLVGAQTPMPKSQQIRILTPSTVYVYIFRPALLKATSRKTFCLYIKCSVLMN
jgi:hypothetical protein